MILADTIIDLVLTPVHKRKLKKLDLSKQKEQKEQLETLINKYTVYLIESERNYVPERREQLIDEIVELFRG